MRRIDAMLEAERAMLAGEVRTAVGWMMLADRCSRHLTLTEEEVWITATQTGNVGPWHPDWPKRVQDS